MPFRLATLVFRQNLGLAYDAGTVPMSVVPELTSKSCPVNAFCGRPPSAGGLKRGSIHVPVHVGGVLRVHGGVVVRLLVADQRPVGRVRGVDVWLPIASSRTLVAAEERQVHARVAGCLDVRALCPSVLVVGRAR